MASDDRSDPPSLYDYLGGAEALTRLMTTFYTKVKADELLAPVFARMPADHPAHVAQFVGEVFGGPDAYSQAHGADAHHHMLLRHAGRHLTEAQRHRWVTLLQASADEVELPGDPEFRSAFAAYIEWGSRLAVINSNLADPPPPPGPMPKWGWGVPGGPYVPPKPEKDL